MHHVSEPLIGWVPVDQGNLRTAYEGVYAVGDGLVSKVEVNFLRGDSPVAERNDPSEAFAAEKAEFGSSRRNRWFGA